MNYYLRDHYYSPCPVGLRTGVYETIGRPHVRKSVLSTMRYTCALRPQNRKINSTHERSTKPDMLGKRGDKATPENTTGFCPVKFTEEFSRDA